MKIVKTLVPVLLLVLGVGVLVYPKISNYVNQRNSSYAVQALDAQLTGADSLELERQRALAENYNAALLLGEEEGYDNILDFGHGVMGAVEIPAIQVKLPIYHGVSEEVLSKGVGHLPSSAFPIGGEGNHAVLTGHTGLPSAKLFTDLVKLEVGDVFHIRVLEEVLTYRVDQVKVVLPTDGSDLAPQPQKDYCTLLTCTPYGVNSHRLLVRGERLQTQEAVNVMSPQVGEAEAVNWTHIAVGAVLILTLSLGLLLWLLKRKRC